MDHFTGFEHGFAILSAVLGAEQIGSLREAVAAIGDQAGVRSRGGVYAVRHLLEHSPAIRALAESEPLCRIATAGLGREAFPVRGIQAERDNPRMSRLTRDEQTMLARGRPEVTRPPEWAVGTDYR